MGEASTQASQRELAIGVLLEIAQDVQSSPEERMNAACAVLEATGVAPSQSDQDEALRKVGDQVAERVLERIEFVDVTALQQVTG